VVAKSRSQDLESDTGERRDNGGGTGGLKGGRKELGGRGTIPASSWVVTNPKIKFAVGALGKVR